MKTPKFLIFAAPLCLGSFLAGCAHEPRPESARAERAEMMRQMPPSMPDSAQMPNQVALRPPAQASAANPSRVSNLSSTFEPPKPAPRPPSDAPKTKVLEPTVRTPGALKIPASSRSPTASRDLEEANHAFAKGEWTKAVQSLDSAEEGFKRANDREGEGMVALNRARVLQTVSRQSADNPDQRQRIIKDYQTAIRNAPRPKQGLARNNLAALYLREGKPHEAIPLLQEVDWAALSPEESAPCLYNLGRAYEQSGQGAKALEQYRLAHERQRDFQPAVDALFRLWLGEPGSRNLPAAAALAELLIAEGQAAQAMSKLRTALAEMPDDPESPLLLVALVRGYAATRMPPPTYEKEEKEILERAAARANRLRALVSEVNDAFAAAFSPSFSRSAASETFRAWMTIRSGPTVMSQLLLSVGDFYLHQPQESDAQTVRALACYSTAWTMDRSSPEAALYTAAMLQEHPTTLDPNGENLNQLLDSLFQEKGNAYSNPLKTKQDWIKLQRLHVVLSLIFEKQKRWGNENRIDSAIFQLTRATELEDRIRQEDPNYPPSPDLYARLGRALVSAGRPADGWGFLLKATEALVYFGQKGQAKEVLSEAMALNVPVNSDMKKRMEAVQRRL